MDAMEKELEEFARITADYRDMIKGLEKERDAEQAKCTEMLEQTIELLRFLSLNSRMNTDVRMHLDGEIRRLESLRKGQP